MGSLYVLTGVRNTYTINKGVDCVDNYTAYIRKAIMETIAATEDEKLLKYVYTILMSAVNSRQDSAVAVTQDS